MNKNNFDEIKKSLEKVAKKSLPRILTQFCRDPNSEEFGCVDRNWWHYKIRDYPSIILQQAALTIHTACQLEAKYSNKFNSLINASINFWNKRAKKYGAFEEYYPWEEGYPPLAFSTLAIMIVINDRSLNTKLYQEGVTKAAHQLKSRFEDKAANQQIAGLAALAHIKNLYPELVSNKEFEKLSLRSLSLQNPEGWFYEYGGPDLGYLSVTIDCLWDLYDATNDIKFIKSAEKSLFFIYYLISWSNGNNIGIHNSRNTDYIVPYGICRFLEFKDRNSEMAFSILNKVFRNSDNENHFLSSIDDRYWCHYIGTSIYRALKIMPNNVNTLKQKSPREEFRYFHHSGYLLIKDTKNKIIISTKKGGILSVYQKNKFFSDFGWHFIYKKDELVNNFWSQKWESNLKQNINNFEVNICGNLYCHSPVNSNPFNHFILRISSLLFRRFIIKFLKNKFIFKRNSNKYLFKRNIKIYEEKIIIKDRFSTNDLVKLSRAPRSSKRHVASSDNSHEEDFKKNKFSYYFKKISNEKKEVITKYLLNQER